jgi:hypothetical protein
MCNGAHSEYVRGLFLEEIESVVHANYDSYMQIDPTQSDSYGFQSMDPSGPIWSSEELNQNMITLNISKCEPLTDRFAEWEEKALNPSRRRKSHFHSVLTVFP